MIYISDFDFVKSYNIRHLTGHIIYNSINIQILGNGLPKWFTVKPTTTLTTCYFGVHLRIIKYEVLLNTW